MTPTPAPTPVSAAAGWKALLPGRFVPPLCKHKEPTVERTVLKAGANLGRKFFVCHRPDGLQSDPNARCTFFMWYSDYKRLLATSPKPLVP